MNFSIFRRFYLAPALLFFVVLPVSAQLVDTSFGVNGTARIFFNGINPFGVNDSRPVKAFNLPEGKILLVANHRHVSIKTGAIFHTMRLVRYTNAGVGDTPQNDNSGTIATRGNFIATDAAMQPDGKIVVVGYIYQNPQAETGKFWGIARYNQNGTPDTVSGFEWFTTRHFGNNIDIPTDVEIQADGKIVVLGTSFNPSADVTVTVIARYNSNALPDLSFGSNGEGFFDIYDSGTVSKKLAVQPDGRLLLAGTFGGNALIARYNQNGLPDAAFGGGYVTLNYNNQEILSDLKLQPDGKILALMDSFFILPGTTFDLEGTFVLARLNPDGSSDSSFTPNGAVFINTSPASLFDGRETFPSLLVRGNGNILISGLSYQNALMGPSFGYLLTVLEYSGSGQFINKTFSRHTRVNQALSMETNFVLIGSLEQTDGKILLYGITPNGGFSGPPFGIILARFASVSAVKDANFYYDYNFDGSAEYAVYRPNQSGFGTWFILYGSQYSSIDYGAAGDILAPGDYDGDSLQDLSVFRPATGEWITRRAYVGNCSPTDCVERVQFGANGDIPAPGDFDGDGKTDRAVFRPSGGDWYVLYSSGGFAGLHFGQNGDKPVVGDYDGDGKSDFAVIRRQNGNMFWYILQSSNGAFVALQFGISEDKTVVADYNGDAKTEIAVWRPSDGTWYVLTDYTSFAAVQFGAAGDIPEAADYDRDRRADFAVFRPSTGTHYVLRSSNGSSTGTQFGAATDIPVASAYVR